MHTQQYVSLFNKYEMTTQLNATRKSAGQVCTWPAKLHGVCYFVVSILSYQEPGSNPLKRSSSGATSPVTRAQARITQGSLLRDVLTFGRHGDRRPPTHRLRCKLGSKTERESEAARGLARVPTPLYRPPEQIQGQYGMQNVKGGNIWPGPQLDMTSPVGAEKQAPSRV